MVDPVRPRRTFLDNKSSVTELGSRAWFARGHTQNDWRRSATGYGLNDSFELHGLAMED